MAMKQKTLEDYTAQELADLAAEMGQAFALFMDDLRKEAFERIGNEMVTPRIATWAKEMESRFGPKVRVNRDELSWPAALAAVSYSGEVKCWPERFDANAEQIAHRWALGKKTPTYVTYLQH